MRVPVSWFYDPVSGIAGAEAVVAESISDWYANASAREHGRHQHDWENDDPVDRTRDSWLDDRYTHRSAKSRSAPGAAAEAIPRGQSLSGRRGGERLEIARAARRVLADEPNLRRAALVARLSGRFNLLNAESLRRALGTIHQKDLAAAAQALHGTKAGANVKTVANHLRTRGWPTVTHGDVRAALDADLLVQRQPPAPPPPSSLTRAVWTLDAETPGRGAPTVAQELRRRGFRTATAKDVERARREPVPRPEPAVRAKVFVEVGPRRRATPASTSVAAPVPVRPRTPVTPPRTPDTGKAVPAPDPALAPVAVRVILAMLPQIGMRKLLPRLRACGWTRLAEAEAERIVAEIRGEAQDGGPLKPVIRNAAATAVAVRAYHTVNSGSSTKIMKCLQQWGWESVTIDEVHRVQVQLPAKSSKSKRASGRKPVRIVLSPPRQPPPNMVGPHRTLDLPERPNAHTCHGCGRIVSSLGYCGCS